MTNECILSILRRQMTEDGRRKVIGANIGPRHQETAERYQATVSLMPCPLYPAPYTNVLSP